MNALYILLVALLLLALAVGGLCYGSYGAWSLSPLLLVLVVIFVLAATGRL